MQRALLIKLLLISVLIYSTNTCPFGWYQSLVDAERCYFVAQEQLSWSDAESYCDNLGQTSHLTSVLSAFETAEIALSTNNSSLGSLDQVWIGATGTNQDSSFAWVDGNPFVYTNWQIGQPNIMQPCVSTAARSSGRWSTESCETKNYFICKALIAETTTIVASTTEIPPTSSPIICPKSIYPESRISSLASPMTDCYDWRSIGGASTDGIYQIRPPGMDSFDVWCDMTTDGGGWTVFQKRMDNCTTFWNRNWADYKSGFDGGLDRSYWLGLDRIHLLSTKDANITLRIDLYGNRCNHFYVYGCDPMYGPGVYLYGVWALFSVENEVSKYRLHISDLIDGNITSDSSDKLHTSNNNQSFSTVDSNNQIDQSESCAIYDNWGAWWYGRGDDGLCSYYCLNGKYYPDDDGLDGTGPKGMWIFHASSSSSGFVIPMRSEIKFRKTFHEQSV